MNRCEEDSEESDYELTPVGHFNSRNKSERVKQWYFAAMGRQQQQENEDGSESAFIVDIDGDEVSFCELAEIAECQSSQESDDSCFKD